MLGGVKDTSVWNAWRAGQARPSPPEVTSRRREYRACREGFNCRPSREERDAIVVVFVLDWRNYSVAADGSGHRERVGTCVDAVLWRCHSHPSLVILRRRFALPQPPTPGSSSRNSGVMSGTAGPLKGTVPFSEDGKLGQSPPPCTSPVRAASMARPRSIRSSV